MSGKKACIVGLTGQSGAGKTIACDYFKSCGYAIINCDLVAREVTSDGSTCLSDLVDEFSDEILNEDGSLNRKKLGAIVFADTSKLKRLEELIFPYILKKIEVYIANIINQGYSTIILDAPTLFESGANTLCDFILGVVADEDIRRNRIMARDNLTVQEANNRMKSQHDTKFFGSHCNFVIENNADLNDFHQSLHLANQSIQGVCQW